MLSPLTRARIRSLLKGERYSYREIARRTGVSRHTVERIDEMRLKAESARHDDQPPDDLRHDDPLRDAGHPFRVGPVERCPTCGARVYLPCVLCKVRAEVDGDRSDRRQKAAGDWGRRK